MSSLIAATRFSVLDRSRTREGHPPSEALRDTVRLAREVERLGYHRFWVSEHHGVPGVAGSAPTVLAAAVAGATRAIRVGTGGVMLPNHQPLVVAGSSVCWSRCTRGASTWASAVPSASPTASAGPWDGTGTPPRTSRRS